MTTRLKISILDDYFDTLRTLPCFRKLDGHDVDDLERPRRRTSTRSPSGCATPRRWC